MIKICKYMYLHLSIFHFYHFVIVTNTDSFLTKSVLNKNYSSSLFFLYCTGLRDPHIFLIIVITIPEQRLRDHQTLSLFLLRFMCYFSCPLMVMFPPSLPPPIFPRIDLHVYNPFSCACISLSTSCLLSVRLLFIPSPPQERRLSPAVRPYD